MVIDLVRSRTTSCHQKLDHEVSAFLTSIQETDDYCALLDAFYGFFAPLKKSVRQHINRQIFDDVDERRSAQLLLEDMHASGCGREPKLFDGIELVQDEASAAAALYVMEGSTLGGKFISAMLRKQLGEDLSLRFFSAYGPDNGKMWKRFLEQMQHPDLTEHAEKIAEAAENIFNALSQWLHTRMKDFDTKRLIENESNG